MNFENLYHFVRRLLFEILVYFFLQGILLVILAVIVVLYPLTLNLLVSLGFLIFALISFYLALRLVRLFHKVKKIKEAIIE